jgi:hypothetical protein
MVGRNPEAFGALTLISRTLETKWESTSIELIAITEV